MLSITGLLLLGHTRKDARSRAAQQPAHNPLPYHPPDHLRLAIRAELQRAAQLLPPDDKTPPGKLIESYPVDLQTEPEWKSLPAPPEQAPIPAALPIYPCCSALALNTRSRPPLAVYPIVATLEYVPPAPSVFPAYPVAAALHYPAPLSPPPLRAYPQTDLNLIALSEESAFESDFTAEQGSADTTTETEDEHSWLPPRERADALFAVCQLYQQLAETEIPLSLLIGGNQEDELLQLSSESLDGALHLKEQIDELIEVFGFDSAADLFDHLFYGSIAADREERLHALLSTLTPLVMESLTIQNPAQREQLYQQIFDHLFEAGEFLNSERQALFEKWHEEYVPPAPPEEEDSLPSSPDEQFTPASASTRERIANALQNLQQQQELELSTPQQQQRAAVEMEREQLDRKRKTNRLDTLAQGHGLSLQQLLENGDNEQSREQQTQLLNLLLSARSDTAEEYIHFRGHLRGTPADLLIESLLRIQLQNRTCSLYQKLSHLDDFEEIETQLFTQLQQEFGQTVIHNHHKSIEQHLEWASSSGRPHCNNTLIQPQAEP